MAWEDLSTAGLVEGGFNVASPVAPNGLAATGVALSNYLPTGKMGNGNYVVIWSGGWTGADAMNYFSISAVTGLYGQQSYSYNFYTNAPGLSVLQAYNIDKKMDDGLPQSGNVLAIYNTGVGTAANVPCWAAALTYTGNPYSFSGHGNLDMITLGPTTSATPASSLTCYDNGGVVGTEKYSVGQNNGGNINCALSFRFQ